MPDTYHLQVIQYKDGGEVVLSDQYYHNHKDFLTALTREKAVRRQTGRVQEFAEHFLYVGSRP